MRKTTARGFEPLRAEPNGFLFHHLNHSATLSQTRSETGSRAHPDLNQGPADLQSAALTTELCTHMPIRTDRLLQGGARVLQCPIIPKCWQRQAGGHMAAVASKPLWNLAMEFAPKQVWSSGYDVSLTR